MEVQHFHVQLYLAIGFGLIFLVMSSNAMPTTHEVSVPFCWFVNLLFWWVIFGMNSEL